MCHRPNLIGIRRQCRHRVAGHEEHHADDEDEVDGRWGAEGVERLIRRGRRLAVLRVIWVIIHVGLISKRALTTLRGRKAAWYCQEDGRGLASETSVKDQERCVKGLQLQGRRGIRQVTGERQRVVRPSNGSVLGLGQR